VPDRFRVSLADSFFMQAECWQSQASSWGSGFTDKHRTQLALCSPWCVIEVLMLVDILARMCLAGVL
jgi:hypothetical protein